MKQSILLVVLAGLSMVECNCHSHSHQFDHQYHLRHHHAGFWKVIGYRMLCSPDGCVPEKVKESIKNGWTDTGRGIWNQCVPDDKCEIEDVRQIVHCMFRTLIENRTDITIKEFRQTMHSLSVKGLVETCEDQITLKMIRCAKPQMNSTEHRRRHYRERSFRRQFGDQYKHMRHLVHDNEQRLRHLVHHNEHRFRHYEGPYENRFKPTDESGEHENRPHNYERHVSPHSNAF